MSTTALSRRGFAAGVAALAAASARPAAAVVPGRYALDTDVWTGSVLVDQEGRSFVLRDLRQPITLLKLWASWCPICVAEMPQLAAMAASMGPRLGIILVSHPEYWAADQAFARRRGISFRMATFGASNPAPIVQQALLGQGGVYAVPRSLVFRERDRSIVLKRASAMDWASPSVLGEVRGLAE